MTEKMLVNCPHCTRSIKIPEQFRGRAVNCPGCGGAFQIAGPPAPAPAKPVNPVPTPAAKAQVATPNLFTSDCYCFKQSLLQLSVHKQITDANGRQLFHVEEPRPWSRQILANVAWFGTLIVVVLILFLVALARPKPGTEISGGLRFFLIIVLFSLIALMIAGPTLAYHLVSPRYDIKVYRSDGGQRGPLLLTIRSEYAIKGLKEAVVVEDDQGRVIGRFVRNWLTGGALRNHWRCLDDSDGVRFSARQSPTKRIILHKLAWMGCPPIPGVRRALLWSLEPVWEINGADAEPHVARFRPTKEIDWGNDRNQTIDRRLGLSFGLLLDSGRWRLFGIVSSGMELADEAGEVVSKLKS